MDNSDGISHKQLLDVMLDIKGDLSAIHGRVSSVEVKVEALPIIEKRLLKVETGISRAYGGIALLTFVVTMVVGLWKQIWR